MLIQSPKRRLLATLRAWLGTAAVSLGLCAASFPVFAAAPPAGTLIRNSASASYVDPNGQLQTTSSNEVQTTIQQVGSFMLDNVSTTTTTVFNYKTGAPGTTIYAQHIVTNTGNGSDNFTVTVKAPSTVTGALSNVLVFLDANFDGVPDTPSSPLACSASSGTWTCPAVAVAGNGGQYGFVVAYILPASASTATPWANSLVTATPATTALYAASNQSASDVDNLNTTTGSAFNLSKTIAQPGAGVVLPSGAWPTATASGQRSSLASCALTVAAAQSPAAGCQYTVYTLTYTNNGASTGRFALRDVIGTGATAGLTYVPHSTVWSGASGTVLIDSGGAGNPAGTDFQYGVTANTMAFVDNAVPPNTQRSISFIVLINNAAALGAGTTLNQVLYTQTDDSSATAAGAASGSDANLTGTSNSSAFSVLGSYGVVMGTTAGSIALSQDTTPGTPRGTAADTSTVASAVGSSVQSFTQRVWNIGNTTDTFNISYASTFPAGTTIALYKADGTTPLSDTNGDAIVDTGPVAAGASVDIVVKVTLPATAVTLSAGPYTATLRATSVSDASKYDASADVITQISSTVALVDLTNTAIGTTGASGDLGTGPSTNPTSTNMVAAGNTTVFSLFVKNGDTIANTYTFAAGSNSALAPMPSGWVVRFVAGNVSAAGCATATALTDTGTLSAGTQSQFTACVMIPVTQSLGTALPLYFQVRNNAASSVPTSTGVAAVDTKYDAVTVTASAATYGFTLTPNGSGQVAPGGSVVYTHLLTNTGSASCTSGSVTLSFSSGPNTSGGWSAVIYNDQGSTVGYLDASDGQVTGTTIAINTLNNTNSPATQTFNSGQALRFFVKEYSNGALPGATDTVTLQARITGCGDSNTYTVTTNDVTAVSSGLVRLVKTQQLVSYTGSASSPTCSSSTPAGTWSVNPISAARPGDCIWYTVVATNQGAGTVTNVTLSDAVPSFSSMISGMTPTCTASSLLTGTFANASTTSAAICNFGAASNSMGPGGTATLIYGVQLNH